MELVTVLIYSMALTVFLAQQLSPSPAFYRLGGFFSISCSFWQLTFLCCTAIKDVSSCLPWERMGTGDKVVNITSYPYLCLAALLSVNKTVAVLVNV